MSRAIDVASKLIIASVWIAAAAASTETTGKTWEFTYTTDPFRSDALLDLRYLNESSAGQSGFIRRTPDGSDFTLGDGTPIRFWAVNTDIQRRSQEDMDRQARFLAKIGVNMVRMHGSFAPKGKGKKMTDVDEQEIDRAWRLVAAMKKQGIYVTLSPYWPNGGHTGTAASWGIDGYGDGADLWGLLFFRDDLRDAYKTWMKALYKQPNPYTGIPLAQDPAVAIIQIQNEDSLFFWTTQGIKPPQMKLLRRKFAQWLVARYGSLPKAKEAWDNFGVNGDAFEQGQAGLMNVWPMTQPQKGGAAKRLCDEVHFYSETMRSFYADIAHFYRDELGCKQLINAGNWITADPVRLNDLERWTYLATDISAVNKYYNGGPHVGANNGWRIDPGDRFEGLSVLRNPTALPTNLKQVVGQPMLITESTWVAPLGYQAEGPFLVAAYQSLTGVDAFYWFSADRPAYNLDPYFPYHTFPDGQKGIFKWGLPPAVTTQFPAAALMFRRGYLLRGTTVVHEERAMEDLWQRRTPIITEGKTFDPNRDRTDFAEGVAVKTVVDPLAFLVGPVEVKYAGDPAQCKVIDLSKYIDAAAKTVVSVTGEIKLNHGIGFCTIDAPKAQGAAGFWAQAKEVRLSDITVQSGNDYAVVMVIPLDDQPLKTSRKVLVQYGTEMRPTGWKTEPATFQEGKETYRGHKIVNTGHMPWQVVNAEVTLTIRNAQLTKATLLDAAGYRKKDVAVSRTEGGVTMTLPAETVYVVVE